MAAVQGVFSFLNYIYINRLGVIFVGKSPSDVSHLCSKRSYRFDWCIVYGLLCHRNSTKPETGWYQMHPFSSEWKHAFNESRGRNGICLFTVRVRGLVSGRIKSREISQKTMANKMRAAGKTSSHLSRTTHAQNSLEQSYCWRRGSDGNCRKRRAFEKLCNKYVARSSGSRFDCEARSTRPFR
jgi:hypothetical protein